MHFLGFGIEYGESSGWQKKSVAVEHHFLGEHYIYLQVILRKCYQDHGFMILYRY